MHLRTGGHFQPKVWRCEHRVNRYVNEQALAFSVSFISKSWLRITVLSSQYIQIFMNETWLEHTGVPLENKAILLL